MKGWLDKYVEGGELDKNALSGVKNVLSAVGDVTSAPARGLTYLATGKYQDPSEAMGITNPYGAFATDMVLDPMNLVGAGLLKLASGPSKLSKVTKAASKLSKAADVTSAIKNYKSPDIKLDPNKFPGPKNIPINPKQFNQAVKSTLSALTERGQKLDQVTGGKFNVTPDDIHYHGTFAARPIVEVKTPHGSEYFYKSTGWGGKKEVDPGQWQVFGQWMDAPAGTVKPNSVNDWFVKGKGFDQFYGSQSFGNVANSLDDALIKKYNVPPEDLNKFLNFQNMQSDANTFIPKRNNGGWLDKYQDGGVAKTDATRTSPALNYRSVEDSARIEREKELARRKTSVGPQSKPSVAMKQAAEERYAQQKRNEKYKKIAEYAQVIGGGLEVAAPFTGPLYPIVGGAGTITSAGSSAYLAGRDVADENYGSALMNAGFGGLGIAGYTPAARATNIRGVNVANAANAADYVSDVATTYNAYDDYGSNYAQRIQNIRQHVTDDELQDILRPRRSLTPYNNKLRSHPDDGFFEPQEYIPDPENPFIPDIPDDFFRKPKDVGSTVMGMPIPSNITPSPRGGLFGMTAEQTNSAWANYNPLDLSSLITSTSLRGRLDQRIQSALGMNSPRNLITSSRPRQSLLQSLGESIYTGLGGSRRSHNQYVPFSQLVAEQNAGRGMTNISGFGNEQLLASDALINKDVVAKMAPEEFASTIYKPSGEVAPYQNMYDPLPGVYGMSPSQYANRFNENLDLLNDIISKQNKTGVDYRVTGLDESGMLTFHTPKQIKRWQDDPFNIQVLEGLEKLKNDPVELQKRLQANGQTLEDFDRILNSFKEADEIIPEGNRTWATRIIPGEFRGEIQDIPNAEYYKSIPGLNMASSSQGVFSDTVTRRGSGAYEAINEYLKRLDLGRVKPGFNSQSDSSRPLWENAIKKGKAFGYYSNPHTVYGAMKTVAPLIGAGAVASQLVDQKKNGGWLEKYNDGGPVQPNYNDASVSMSDDFIGDGYSNVGRNYSPAWGGQFAMGGSVGGATQGIPGATGFMYARVSDSTPSKAKGRNKEDVTDASAENGKEMKFYQEGLDFKPKSISKNGSKVIKDDRGQWAHPGEITEIGSNQITMQGVDYPVLGISDTGDMQMMYPNQEYQYDGNSVTEYPMAQDGRQVAYVDSVLNANKDLNWVKRLYDVNRKSIMLPGQKDPSTHFMESGDGRVYPTVVEMPNGKLKHLGDKAYDYADSTNTFIQFPDDSAAQWFGKNYKQGTGVLKKKKQGGQLTKLDQLTNFTNYNTKQPGGWLDRYDY